MDWSVTWTDSERIGIARMDSEAEADTIVCALGLAQIDQVAKWNPAGKCVWANGVQDSATLSEPTREEKGCTHPAEEPCFPVARADGSGPEYDGKEGLK